MSTETLNINEALDAICADLAASVPAVNPSNVHVLVDFDGTLYDSHRLLDDLSTAVSNLPDQHVSAEDFRNRYEEFKRPITDTDSIGVDSSDIGEGYDFFSHMEALDIDEQSAQGLLKQQIRSRDYFFPGAVDFLKGVTEAGYEVRVLSFGWGKWQRAKIESALGSLGLSKQIPVTTSATAKNHDVARLHKPNHHYGYLVDDVPVSDLPPGYKFIHIENTDAEPV